MRQASSITRHGKQRQSRTDSNSSTSHFHADFSSSSGDCPWYSTTPQLHAPESRSWCIAFNSHVANIEGISGTLISSMQMLFSLPSVAGHTSNASTSKTLVSKLICVGTLWSTTNSTPVCQHQVHRWRHFGTYACTQGWRGRHRQSGYSHMNYNTILRVVYTHLEVVWVSKMAQDWWGEV